METPKHSSFHQPGRGIPLVLTLLFGLILITLYAFSPTVLFVYGEQEYFNRLFSHSPFLQLLDEKFVSYVFPWQNLNLLCLLFLKITNLLFLQSLWLLVAAQIGLAWLILYRIQILLHQEFPSDHYSLFFVLLACHPVLWTTLVTKPSLVLTLWLLIESLIELPRLRAHPLRGLVFLLLLSFSGILGFLSAMFLCVGYMLYEITRSEPSKQAWMFALPPLFPSFLFYLILSVQSGIIGGPYLADTDTFLSNLSFATFLNGLWTEHLQKNLLWLSHGFLSWPVPLPLLGFLFFIGVLHAWENQPKYRNRYLSLAIFFFLFIILFSFSHPKHFQQSSLLFLPFVLLFVLHAIARISQLHPKNSVWIQFVFVIAFAFLSLTQFPTRWEHILNRAIYYESISYTLLNNLDVLDANGENPLNEPLPLRFSAPLYASFPESLNFTPYGFALYSQHPNLGGDSQGIRISLPLHENPNYIIAYPRFEEAKRQGIDTLPELFQDQAIERRYEQFQIQNVIFFMRRNAIQEEALPQGTPIGEQWHFETKHANVKKTGLAFGSQPDTSQHRYGMASAGPENIEAGHLQGIMESDVFVIEGKELHVAAKMPKDSTKSLICLAVFESNRYGAEGEIRSAKHVYEHEPHTPLMDDVFYYIHPSTLEYTTGWIHGWRVVRLLKSGFQQGWQQVRWSLDPWQNQQARWLAADRDPDCSMWVDEITQHQRPSGYYWNFEDGTYQGWRQSGNAWGETPAQGAYGTQNPIINFEGNYLINTYYEGSDWPVGVLSRTTPAPIEINLSRLSFLIGGGEDLERLYVALVVNGKIVKKATGRGTEELRRVTWDITPWVGNTARILIVDRSSEAWGHLLVDDIRIYEKTSDGGGSM